MIEITQDLLQRAGTLKGHETLNDFLQDEIDLITLLMKKNHWIEEESLDLVQNLNFNKGRLSCLGVALRPLSFITNTWSYPFTDSRSRESRKYQITNNYHN